MVCGKDIGPIPDGLGEEEAVFPNVREDNPGDDILRISSPKAIMRVLSVASAPAWRTESKTIDREEISGEALEDSDELSVQEGEILGRRDLATVV